MMLKLSPQELLANPERIAHIMPNELLCIDMLIGRGCSRDQLADAIRIASRKTKKVSILLEKHEYEKFAFKESEFLKNLNELGLTRFHIVIDLNIAAYTYSGVGYKNPAIRKLAFAVREIGKICPEVKMIPCLSCPVDQILHLGPLIYLFVEDKCREIILIPPARRTKRAVDAYINLFEYCRIRDIKSMWISFDYFVPNFQIWNIQTFNSFAGPTYVHFDISNKCTHSCNFCGLYGPDAVEAVKAKPPHAQAEVHEMMRAMLDHGKGRSILENLPEIVTAVQFGGVGDPMLHPHFFDFVRIVRERGIHCEILSNMDYFTDELITKMSQLGSKRWSEMHFIANVSGASSEMYLKTRPRQTKKNFDHVMYTLKRLKEERLAADGQGVHVTMMCVMNKTNYSECVDYVRMTHELGAHQVYLKPMEVHIEHQTSLLIDDSIRTDYALKVKEAMKTADELGIGIMDRDGLLRMVEQNV